MKIPDMYIKELVHGIAGDRAVDLVFLIKDKENVSEFKIAEKMGITVNEVRNVLYRLQDRNLVFFTRKKDKKKGWYIYFWTFDMPKARDLLLEIKRRKQQELHQVLKEEKPGNVYVCPNKCVRFNAEQALEHQFRCPECDAVLREENVEKRTEKIKKDLERLHLEMEELSKIQKPLPKLELEKKPKKKERGKKAPPKRKAEKKGKVKFKPKHKGVLKRTRLKTRTHKKPKVHVPPPKRGFLSTLKNKFSRRA